MSFYFHHFIVYLACYYLNTKSTQLCINTAIVYMHRFYMFQRFQRFNKNVSMFYSLFFFFCLDNKCVHLYLRSVKRNCIIANSTNIRSCLLYGSSPHIYPSSSLQISKMEILLFCSSVSKII